MEQFIWMPFIEIFCILVFSYVLNILNNKKILAFKQTGINQGVAPGIKLGSIISIIGIILLGLFHFFRIPLFHFIYYIYISISSLIVTLGITGLINGYMINKGESGVFSYLSKSVFFRLGLSIVAILGLLSLFFLGDRLTAFPILISVVFIYILNDLNKKKILVFGQTGIKQGMAPGIKLGFLSFILGIILYIGTIFFPMGSIFYIINISMILIGPVGIINGYMINKKAPGVFLRINPIVSLVCMLGLGYFSLLLSGVGGGMAHGRVLFLGKGIKPRKASIQKNTNWLL